MPEPTLVRANDVRIQRARLLAELPDNPLVAAVVLHDPSDWSEGMRVRQLLAHVPGIGDRPHGVARLLADVGVSRSVAPFKTIGELTPRQRGLLAQAVRDVTETRCLSAEKAQEGGGDGR